MYKKFLSSAVALLLVICFLFETVPAGADTFTVSKVYVGYEGLATSSDFSSTYVNGMGAGYLSSDSRVKIISTSGLVPTGSRALSVNTCDMRWWTLGVNDTTMTFEISVTINEAFANVFTPCITTYQPSFSGCGLAEVDPFIIQKVGDKACICDYNGNTLKELSNGTYKLTCKFTRGSSSYELLCNGTTVSSSVPLEYIIYTINNLYLFTTVGTLTNRQKKKGYTESSVYIVIDDVTVSSSGRNTPVKYSLQAPGAVPTVNITDMTPSSIGVYFNDKELPMDNAPVERYGTVFVELAAVAEAVGLEFTENENSQFELSNGNMTVNATCGSNLVYINGDVKKITYNPAKINDVIYVAADFINTVTHAKVWWDADGKIFLISTGSYLNDGILRVIGGKMYMNGEPYYEISFNKFDLFYQMIAEYQYNHEYPTADCQSSAAEAAIKQLSELGFKSVRAFMYSPAYLDLMYNEEHLEIYLTAMDRVFDLCDKYGLKLVVCLGLAEPALLKCDYVENEGWIQSTETVEDIVGNPDCESRQNAYKYIDIVVNRYKDRDTVLLWEIDNELILEADIGEAAGEVKFSLLQLAEFYGACADRIRAIDDKHIIASGDSILRPAQWHLLCSILNNTGNDWNPDTAEQHLKAVALLNEKLDITSMHIYGLNTTNTSDHTFSDGNGGYFSADWSFYADECTKLGKPLYNGEASTMLLETNSSFISESEAYLNGIINAGVQLTHWWTFRADRQGFNDGYTWRVDSGELLSLIVDANKKIKETHCVNACEVLNVAGTSEDYVESELVKSSASDEYIIMVSSGATVSDVLAFYHDVNSEASACVYDSNCGELYISGILRTGMTVKAGSEEYTIIVKGDADCDGNIDLVDAQLLINYVRSGTGLTGYSLDAVIALGKNGKVNILTVTMMLNDILGI